jgi:hypothetical protein
MKYPHYLILFFICFLVFPLYCNDFVLGTYINSNLGLNESELGGSSTYTRSR